VSRPMDPFDVVAEWSRGCSVSNGDPPQQCEECTREAMLAVARWVHAKRSLDFSAAEPRTECLAPRPGRCFTPREIAAMESVVGIALRIERMHGGPFAHGIQAEVQQLREACANFRAVAEQESSR
jgi:hypothetical protein